MLTVPHVNSFFGGLECFSHVNSQAVRLANTCRLYSGIFVPPRFETRFKPLFGYRLLLFWHVLGTEFSPLSTCSHE